MDFQLSYFKSWKMTLWKCCIWYVSEFGKLSSGHRTGKVQFSLQSQRKAMPKNAQSESEVIQSRPTLCDPVDCSLPGSSVHGIFQAIVLEWIAISFSRGSSQPQDWTRVSHIVDRRFTIWATREVPKECSNYRISALISHTSKVMFKILQARFQQYVNCELPDVSSWF